MALNQECKCNVITDCFCLSLSPSMVTSAVLTSTSFALRPLILLALTAYFTSLMFCLHLHNSLAGHMAVHRHFFLKCTVHSEREIRVERR